MIFYIKDGKHVFTLSGLNESQSFDFKAGIEWAYVRKLALQTEQLVGKQMSDTKHLNVLIAKALLLNQDITDSEQVDALTAYINGDIEKKSLLIWPLY